MCEKLHKLPVYHFIYHIIRLSQKFRVIRLPIQRNFLACPSFSLCEFPFEATNRTYAVCLVGMVQFTIEAVI